MCRAKALDLFLKPQGGSVCGRLHLQQELALWALPPTQLCVPHRLLLLPGLQGTLCHSDSASSTSTQLPPLWRPVSFLWCLGGGRRSPCVRLAWSMHSGSRLLWSCGRPCLFLQRSLPACGLPASALLLAVTGFVFRPGLFPFLIGVRLSCCNPELCLMCSSPPHPPHAG